MLLSGVLLTAQKEGHRHQKGHMSDLSPEQMATLQTKKLTLALDLNEAQQKQVQQLHLEQAQLRKAKRSEQGESEEGETGARPTKEERYERHLSRLDAMMAHKAKMKSVLSAEQYEKWEKLNMHRQEQHRPRGRGHHPHGK